MLSDVSALVPASRSKRQSMSAVSTLNHGLASGQAGLQISDMIGSRMYGWQQPR